MGKVKNNKIKCNRHYPLDQQTSENYDPKSSPRNKIKSELPKDEAVDSKLTSNTVKKEESDIKEDSDESNEFPEIQSNTRNDLISLGNQLSADLRDISQNERYHEGIESDDDDEEEEEEEEVAAAASFSGSEWHDENIEIDEDDEKTFSKFMGTDVGKTATLADFMEQKISENSTVDNKVKQKPESNISAYKELGTVLKDYKSGKFPDRFRRIPEFLNWEQLLYLTEPEKWSTASVLEATCIFATSRDPVVVQRFFNTVLLLRIRDKIADSKTLDTPLYHALRRALSKPAAFFKGIILPLCKAENCTLREATIFGYILAKGHISYSHCCAALLTIAEMKYSLTNSVFMKVLLDKGYLLSSRVQNAIVAHFHRLMEVSTKYPVLWYQCLLTFVQIYKDRLSTEQIKNLLQLLTVQRRHSLTEKIVKELFCLEDSD